MGSVARGGKDHDLYIVQCQDVLRFGRKSFRLGRFWPGLRVGRFGLF